MFLMNFFVSLCHRVCLSRDGGVYLPSDLQWSLRRRSTSVNVLHSLVFIFTGFLWLFLIIRESDLFLIVADDVDEKLSTLSLH